MYMLIIIPVLIVAMAAWLFATYNGLVRSNVRVDEAWSDIQVQLKRRYDLIPNLVDTVKGYAQHEKDLLENLTKARSEALKSNGGPEEQAKAENSFAGALKSVFAIAENYPDLKANQNFLKLQEDLTDTEDKIQAARRFYNGSARDLNIKIKVFPTNMFAKSLGFSERKFFEVDEAAVAEPVKVDFNS